MPMTEEYAKVMLRERLGATEKRVGSGSGGEDSPRESASLERGSQRGSKRKSEADEDEVDMDQLDGATIRKRRSEQERLRRDRFNDKVNELRDVLPSKYIQKGDKMSVLNGAIQYIKELSAVSEMRMSPMAQGGRMFMAHPVSAASGVPAGFMPPTGLGGGTFGQTIAYKSAFREAPQPLTISSLDGVVLDMNSSFRKVLDYSKGDTPPAMVSSITYPEDLQELYRAISHILAGTKDAIEVELRFITKTRQIKRLAMSISLLLDSTFKANQLLFCVLDDVTAKAVA